MGRLTYDDIRAAVGATGPLSEVLIGNVVVGALSIGVAYRLATILGERFRRHHENNGGAGI